MKSFIKNAIRWVVSTLGRHRWPTQDSILVILAYHRVLPKSDERYDLEQPMMLVTPESLENNLVWASEHFRFIELEKWLSLCANGKAPKGKFCAVTFDDGWIDNMQYALPVLEKYRVPATIFCVSKMIDGEPNYWPGRLVSLVSASTKKYPSGSYIDLDEFRWLRDVCNKRSVDWESPGQGGYSDIIESVKIYSDVELFELIEKTKHKLELDYVEERQVLNVSELKAIMESGLIDVGSHTINHIRFSDDTKEAVLQDEIVDSRNLLSNQLGKDVKLFCYPNGYHPKRSIEIVKGAYIGACTLEKGWNTIDTEFSVLRRVSIHELVASNKSHFKARLSGWL